MDEFNFNWQQLGDIQEGRPNLLDLMANVVADRQGRTLSRATQSVATMIFLPVSF